MRDRRVRGTSSTEGRASEHREPGKTTLTQQLQRRTVAAPKVGAESLVSGLAGGMGTPQPAGTGTQLERGTGADPSGTGPTARNPADAAKLAKTGTRIELPYRADLEVQLHRDLSNVEVYIGHVPGDLGVSSPGSAEEHEATAAETGTIEGAHAAPTAPAHAATKPMLALKPSKDSFCKPRRRPSLSPQTVGARRASCPQARSCRSPRSTAPATMSS